MFLFEQCRSQYWELALFWNSPVPEVPNCLQYYGFDLIPILFASAIFLIDLFINRNLVIKNKFVDYFKQRCFRLLIMLILIASCVFRIIVTLRLATVIKDMELYQLKLLCNIFSLLVYGILILFDISHFLKNMGTSGLLALAVTIEFASKSYMMFEVGYLHYTSYSIYELVVTTIQFICFSLLFISYVFLPNLPYTNEEKSFNEKRQKDKSINCDTYFNIHEQKGFSIKSRSLFSQIFIFYYESFAFFGYRNKYNLHNILPLEHELKVNSVLDNYEKKYENKYLRDKSYKNFNILHLVFVLYRNFYLFNITIYIVQIIIEQLDPQIISKLITFIKKQNDFKWHALFLTFLLLACFLTRYTITAIFNRNMNYQQARIQVLLVNFIYKKSLKKSQLKDSDNFDVYNLMTVDVNNISNALYFIGDLVYLPVNTGLSIYFLYQELSVSIFYALLLFAIIGPITYVISQKTKRAQQRTMKSKDKRLKILNDLLNGIKAIKLNFWEQIFKEKATDSRDEEMMHFKKYQIFYMILTTLFHCLPVLLSVLSFVIYLKINEDDVLTPEKVFTVLNYFNLLKNSFIMIPRIIHLTIVSFISGRRIMKFLRSEEKDDYVTRDFDYENAVEISKASFSWLNDDPQSSITPENALKDLDIKIRKGNLVALKSDQIASGRSSFISALLGEMRLVPNEKDQTRINISSDMKIAFVGSTPFIEKKSIKENILFGSPYNQQTYNYVIDQCLIREELIKFPDADDQIMDSNLSLEIKQKVSLARAYYSNANLILIDDFLSTFNDYSAKIIFDRIINPSKNSLFKNKTCIMVLNQQEYLSYFDQVLVFNQGRVTCSDNNNNYNSNSNNYDYKKDCDGQKKKKTDLYKRSISSKLYNYDAFNLSPVQTDNHDDKNCFNCKNKLINEEENKKLDLSVYMTYAMAWGKHWLFILVVSYFLSIVFQVQVGNWLAVWSKEKNKTGSDLVEYNQMGLTKYVYLSFFTLFFYTLASIAAVYGEVGAANMFHRKLLDKVLRLNIYFFTSSGTTSANIITRFSKDIDAIDNTIPFFFRFGIYVFFQIASVFFVIIYTFPLISILIAACTVVYLFLFKIFLTSLVSTKQLELQTKTVLYNRFEELNTGLPTILAYDKSEQFTEVLNQKLEANIGCNFMYYIAFKWLALRNEMISIVILIGTALYSIMKDNVDAGQAALVFNFGLSLLGLLMALMGLVGELVINMVSVDRIRQYLNLEEEKYEDPYSRPPEDWSNDGKIKFENYSASYTECRNTVLENLEFEIEKNSFVSLVGNASSGKSSLVFAMLDKIETRKGRILIGGLDTKLWPKQLLKQNLSIMPQEASLFMGSIRFNLDPENLCTDIEIWEVLDSIGIKDQILYLQGNLFYELSDSGSNLSLSQRQLLCLARAILKKSNIIILDVTSFQFDNETEKRLRKVFKQNERTTLLITKNLDHIMDSDKILFLSNKQIKEFKKPDDIFAQDLNNNVDVLDVINNNDANILDIVNNNIE